MTLRQRVRDGELRVEAAEERARIAAAGQQDLQSKLEVRSSPQIQMCSAALVLFLPTML